MNFDDYQMSESTLDLFCAAADEEEFCASVEKKAAELEITVDYYLYEFI